MGRSGSGSGGGGFSGGGFSGGGRSSGGFSGGSSHSDGRSGGQSFGGGCGRPFGMPSWDYGMRPPRPHINTPPVVIVNNSGNRNYGGYHDDPPTRYVDGGGQSSWSIVAIVLAVVFAFILLGSCAADITPHDYSTEVRTALSSNAVSKTGYYTDEDGDWIHSSSKLEKGLADFYGRTGVQPYVYILKNGSETDIDRLTAKSEELYGKLFSDEGHFLLVFCDDGNGSYNCGYTAGRAAKQVMDGEAIGILQNELEKAYDNAASDEEVFSDAFENTGIDIMHAAESKESSEETASALKTVGNIAAVGLVGCAVGGIVIYVRKRNVEKEKEKKEEVEKIMNTPLEKFGDSDSDVEQIASKYETGGKDADTDAKQHE